MNMEVNFVYMGIKESSIFVFSKLAIIAIFLVLVPPTNGLTDGTTAEWCVADFQTPYDLLQGALDWACGKNGTDCTSFQPNHSCHLPDTLVSHASYAFNSYWQNNKQKGASCFFDNAAFLSETDPSHDGCHFVYVP